MDRPNDRQSAALDAALAEALEATGKFRRDTRLGRLLHRGHISLREVSPSGSVHLAFRGNRITAHVDRHSPLNCGSRRRWHYSLLAVAVHNISDVIVEAFRAITGRRRDRCEFTCERVWVDDDDVIHMDVSEECRQPVSQGSGDSLSSCA